MGRLYLLYSLGGGMLLLFVGGVFKGRLRRISTVECIMFAFFLFILASSIWSKNVAASIQQAYYYFLTFSMYVLVSRAAKNRWSLAVCGIGYVAGCFVAALIIIGKWRTGALFDGERLSVGDINANYTAYCLATSIPVMAALTDLRVKGIVWLMPVLTLLFFVAIFMTGCRGALLGGGVAAIYLYMNNIKKNFIYVGLLSFAVAWLWPYLYDSLSVSLQNRLNVSLLIGGDDGAFSGRLSIWPAAIKEFLDSPLLGIGVGAFKEINYEGIGAHNFILSLLVETGLIGLAIYLSLIVVVFWRVILPGNNRKIVSAMALLILWVPIAMTGVWESSIAAWSVFGWFFAYSTFLEERHRNGAVSHG